MESEKLMRVKRTNRASVVGGCVYVSSPNDQKESSGLSGGSNIFRNNNASQRSGQVFHLNIDEIHVDESQWCRSNLDLMTVRKCRDDLLLGDKYPPIVVHELSGKLFVLDGVHRLHAHQLVKKINQGSRSGLNVVGSKGVGHYRIPCRVVEVPDDQLPIVFSFKLNQKNGRPLNPEDYKKVVRKVYAANPGAPVETLAADLNINVKTFKKYAKPFIDQCKEQIELRRNQLLEQDLSDREVSETLKKEFPNAKGLSRSSNQNARRVRESNEPLGRQNQGTEAKEGYQWAELGVDTAAPEKNSSGLQVIFGKRKPVVMIRGIEHLSTELQPELINSVQTLLESITSREEQIKTSMPVSGSSRSRSK